MNQPTTTSQLVSELTTEANLAYLQNRVIQWPILQSDGGVDEPRAVALMHLAREGVLMLEVTGLCDRRHPLWRHVGHQVNLSDFAPASWVICASCGTGKRLKAGVRVTFGLSTAGKARISSPLRMRYHKPNHPAYRGEA